MAGTKHKGTREALEALLDTLSVGDALPPERVLAADLGVSRMTLRRALDDLWRMGKVIRRQGAGTFVAEPKIAQMLTVTSFSQDMLARGLTPTSRTLSMERIDAGPRLASRLEVPAGEPLLRIRRLRLADGTPMAIETLHVPAASVPGLGADDLEDTSFYALLARRYGIHLTRGTQVIEPTVTDSEEADLLACPPHSPAFLFERTSYGSDDTPVEFVRSVYRGDRYKLTAQLQLDPQLTEPV